MIKFVMNLLSNFVVSLIIIIVTFITIGFISIKKNKPEEIEITIKSKSTKDKKNKENK